MLLVGLMEENVVQPQQLQFLVGTFRHGADLLYGNVECKSEGHIKYHPACSTSIVAPFEGQFGIGTSPFHGSFHVFKHSKADGMKPSIAEVNVTSSKGLCAVTSCFAIVAYFFTSFLAAEASDPPHLPVLP